MPMRLAAEQPAVASRLWPPDGPLEAEQTQLGVRIDFMGAGVPTGLLEKVMASALAHTKLLACWRSGLVLSHAPSGSRALLQLRHASEGTTLHVEGRELRHCSSGECGADERGELCEEGGEEPWFRACHP